MTEWLNALASEVGGYYDQDNNLCIDGDFGTSSFAYAEIVQMFRSRMSPRDAADIIRMGGMP